MSKICNSCETESRKTSIPYVEYESAMARSDQNSKRMWIVILVLILALIGTNLAWIVYGSQFDVVEETTITQENENGYNNYIGNYGDINYGETDNNKKEIS